MACLAHECTRCEWASDDNERTRECPKCGASVITTFDEDEFSVSVVDVDEGDLDEEGEDDEA